MAINVINNNFLAGIKRPENKNINNNKSINNTSNTTSFKDILESNIDSVKFSKHATTRLNARDIKLSDKQLERIEEGVLKAGEKGIRDSLVLVDNIALLVNIKNKTVVTAMDSSDGNEKIYTNIDGTVIV